MLVLLLAGRALLWHHKTGKSVTRGAEIMPGSNSFYFWALCWLSRGANVEGESQPLTHLASHQLEQDGSVPSCPNELFEIGPVQEPEVKILVGNEPWEQAGLQGQAATSRNLETEPAGNGRALPLQSFASLHYVSCYLNSSPKCHLPLLSAHQSSPLPASRSSSAFKAACYSQNSLPIHVC